MALKTQSLKKNYKSIISITLLAFLLWFMVKMNRNYEYVLDIPVKFMNLDEDKTFKSLLNNRVHVEFTGKGIDLLRLNFYDLYYQIDLSDAPLQVELDLSQHLEYVKLPMDLNVKVKSILRPRNLHITLDQKIEKKLPVEVNYEFDAPAGYILADVSSNPDSVLVAGPREMFDQIDHLTTEKIVFKNKNRAFDETLEIQKEEKYYASYFPKKVDVTFDIQRLAEKSILDVPVTVINKSENFDVIPLPSSAVIYLKGGEKILADLSLKDFQIIIDFQKVWNPGVKKVKADLITDAMVLHMETRPPEFELIIQKKK